MMNFAKLFAAAALFVAVPANAAAARTETAVLAGGCFWGVEARLPACEGRHQRRVGLCRRRAPRRQLRKGRQRAHRPCRGGADHLRSARQSATASCCRSTSRSRTTRPSSTARAPTPARSTARAIFPQRRRRPRSAARLHRPAGRRAHGSAADRDQDRDGGPSSRPRPITRISARKNPTYPYIVINDRPEGRCA